MAFIIAIPFFGAVLAVSPYYGETLVYENLSTGWARVYSYVSFEMRAFFSGHECPT